MPQTSSQLPNRRAFTLTELLVVIAIIAMLVALTSVGVMTAMAKARATRIKTELDQIDSAMKAYKEKFGSYPPCNFAFNQSGLTPPEKAARLARIKQHLAMAFPRYDMNKVDPSNSKQKLENDLAQAGLDLENFRPDQALVFWLRGFSPNPLNPILSVNGKQIENNAEVGTVIKRASGFFEFDDTRFVGLTLDTTKLPNPSPSYIPAGLRVTTNPPTATRTFPEWTGGAPPMLYWDASFYEFAAPVTGGSEAQPNTFNTTGVTLFTNAGVATPYWHDRNGNGRTNLNVDENSQETWANPDSYQLIACGGDNKYGNANPPSADARMYPIGKNYDAVAMTDDDNATNFTSKARIGDDKP
jgi:prepilin-type N-terminal cleavage/methylation domain-containing protein